MNGGYTGQMLLVDLASGSIQVQTISADQYELFLGGYGLGASYIYKNQKKGVNSLSEESLLGFVTGPLTGTPAISGTRFTVVAKSPLTGGWGDANCGGYFGVELKRAGYDMVFFKGTSEQPVALIINNNNVEIISAKDQWGLGTQLTEKTFKDQINTKAQVACIGPAGERLSLISGIVNNGRLAARSGLGAVMGSKRLKAVVVVGNQDIPLAHPLLANKLRKDLLTQIGGPWAEVWRKYGTAGALSAAVEMGDSPVKNWAGSIIDFPEPQKISDEEVLKRQSKRYGCWRCPIACGGYVVSPTISPHNDIRKPEYETLSSFGPLILNDDLDVIIQMNYLCDQAGMDTISAGAVIAFAIEAFENNIISLSDTDGLALHWGDGQTALRLLRKMINRDGIGDILADGVDRAAKAIGKGAENFAMHIGGQELPMHDPRLTMPFLMGYLLDATPARHNQGSATFIDMPRSWTAKVGVGLYSEEGFTGKTDEHFNLANLVHAVNASGLCIFSVCSFMQRFILPEFMEVVTGWKPDLTDLVTVGERIGTLRMAFNYREGIEPQLWQPPDRVIGKPPLQTGPLTGKVLEIDQEISAYRIRYGWDPISGKPAPERLIELGLDWIVDDLWPCQKS